MEQIVDPVPLVPLLHDVVPQMVEQLVDFLAPLDFRVAEQVIEVPKIVCPPRGARTVLCAPQTAEQLVAVPTEPGYALAAVAVQTLGWTEARALFEQPPPGQGGIQMLATATVAEAVVDVPVIISDMLQQFFVEFVEALQLQFIDIVVGFVASQRQGSQCKLCRRRRFARCRSWIGWDLPVVVQRQAWMVQTVQSGGAALAQFAPFFALLWLSGVERQFTQLGALDDEEFFVIEGWGVALTPGVVLPGVRPPVVH